MLESARLLHVLRSPPPHVKATSSLSAQLRSQRSLVPPAEEAILPDTIFIAHDNDIIRPPAVRDPATQIYKDFVPAFNCSVVSNDPTHGVSRCMFTSTTKSHVISAPNIEVDKDSVPALICSVVSNDLTHG